MNANLPIFLGQFDPGVPGCSFGCLISALRKNTPGTRLLYPFKYCVSQISLYDLEIVVCPQGTLGDNGCYRGTPIYDHIQTRLLLPVKILPVPDP